MKKLILTTILLVGFSTPAYVVWDVTTPAGSEAKSLGDDRLRELKVDIADALDFHGVFPGADTSDPRFIITLSSGNSAGRPSGNDRATGGLYLNTEIAALERWTGTSWVPYSLIPSTSITSTQISTDVAGDGLAGGNGTNFSVKVSTHFSIVTDTVTLAANAVGNNELQDTITVPTLAVTTQTWGGFGILPILQIAGPATDASANTTSNTSFENTGVTQAITPKFSSSKILVIGQGTFVTGTSNCYITLARGGTNLAPGSGGFAAQVPGVNDNVSLIAVDSPSTTSSVTYSIQFRVEAGATCAFPSNTAFGSTPAASLTLIEIAQ